MTIIAGAVKYLNSAKLANTQGRAAIGASLADNMSTDLLDIGRRTQRNGVGLSANSRAYAKQFLDKTKSGFNAIFGMSTVKMSSIENMTMQINAIRAKMPQSQLSEAVRGKILDEQA